MIMLTKKEWEIERMRAWTSLWCGLNVNTKWGVSFELADQALKEWEKRFPGPRELTKAELERLTQYARLYVGTAGELI